MIFVRAWLLMLVLGAIYHITDFRVAFGYWVCLLICLALQIVFAGIKS